MSSPSRRVVSVLALSLVFVPLNNVSGQNSTQEPPIEIGALTVSRGLNVVPVFEGWEQNDDGSFNMVFAYLNRNYDEEIDIPVGPNNSIEPGGPDRGQPTHFYPRRNRFVFRVRVPKDWGKKDVVWTLTCRGKTEKAYGSLLPVEIIDAEVIAANFTGSPSLDKRNKPPTVTLEGSDKREIKVGEPLALSVVVKDDGIPQPRPSPQSRPPGRRSSIGLRVSWIQYRGPAPVTFDPVQALTYSDPRSELSPWTPGWQAPPIPPDGRILTNASFSTPGTYVIRVIAHDGYDYTAKDVTVTVLPPSSAKNN